MATSSPSLFSAVELAVPRPGVYRTKDVMSPTLSRTQYLTASFVSARPYRALSSQATASPPALGVAIDRIGIVKE